MVYKSERYRTVFTWVILLRAEGEDTAIVYLRFRGHIQSTCWKRQIIVNGGDIHDGTTTTPMLAGLTESAERAH